MTCSAPKRFLVVAEREPDDLFRSLTVVVVAEREPDDMFRSQTDVSDRREVQGVIACLGRGAEREPDDRFRSQTVDCDRQEVQDG